MSKTLQTLIVFYSVLFLFLLQSASLHADTNIVKIKDKDFANVVMLICNLKPKKFQDICNKSDDIIKQRATSFTDCLSALSNSIDQNSAPRKETIEKKIEHCKTKASQPLAKEYAPLISGKTITITFE